MYFKSPKGSDTYNKLQAIDKKVQDCKKAAIGLIKELGGNADEYYRSNHSTVAMGGIAAINFTEKPEGWVKRGEKYQMLFMPSSKNNQAWEKINALPTVTYAELNEIYKFKGNQALPPKTVGGGISFGWVNSMGYEFVPGFVLIHKPDGAKWKPLPDCTEILNSEYLKLSKKKEVLA